MRDGDDAWIAVLVRSDRILSVEGDLVACSHDGEVQVADPRMGSGALEGGDDDGRTKWFLFVPSLGEMA